MTDNIYFNYNQTGDIITIIICTILTILIKSTYIRNDKIFKLFKASMFAMFVACISNLVYHYLVIDVTKFWLPIYIAKNTSYSSLIFILLLYNLYMNELVHLKEQSKIKLNLALKVIWAVYTILICITPMTHFGFYIENGIIYENYILNAFTFAYIFYLTVILTTIIKHYKKNVHNVINSLLIIVFISVGIMGIQMFTKSTTYNCLTFLLPIIAVLFLFHNNTYDTNLSALGVNAFSSYLEELQSKNKKFTLYSFYINNIDKFKSLNNVFLESYNKIFGGSYLFKINDSRVVIVYENVNNALDNKKLENVLKIFENKYATYNVDYKMVIVNSNHFLNKTQQYIKFTKYIESKINNNTSYIATKEDINKFKEEIYILNELQDICNKQDLNDERVLVYCQPIYNVKENKFDTAESLMRLNLKEIGLVYPDVFIPLAESNGYIHMLSKIILNKVCKQLSLLEKENYNISRISVNFVTDELNNENFFNEIKEIIDKNKINYSKIGIEITESENTEDFMKIINTVKSLRDNKITVYIDDFGTGYSNFVKTLAIPIDVVKFDKSLVHLSQDNNSYRVVIDKFADIFNQLDYSILFEGIETDADENRCIGMKANYLQGYKYSKPIPIEELKGFLERRN